MIRGACSPLQRCWTPRAPPLLLRANLHASPVALARKKKLTKTAEQRKDVRRERATESQTATRLNAHRSVPTPRLRVEDVPGAFPKRPFSDAVLRQLTYRHPAWHFAGEKGVKAPAFDLQMHKTIHKAAVMAGIDPKARLNLDPQQLLVRAQAAQARRAKAAARRQRPGSQRAVSTSKASPPVYVNVSNSSNPLETLPRNLPRGKPAKRKQFEREARIRRALRDMPKTLAAFRAERRQARAAARPELPF